LETKPLGPNVGFSQCPILISKNINCKQFKENQTGSRLTHAEKKRVERDKKRRNGEMVIGGRGIIKRSGVGWTGERMI